MPLDQPSISGIKKETDLLSILAGEWNMEEMTNRTMGLQFYTKR